MEDAPGLRRGFPATWLKYFAALFMLLDHTEAIFGLMGAVAEPGTWPYYLLRNLGRMSFPIFLFFVAEGCCKTHDFPGYLKRLFAFSLISQIPFSLAFGLSGGNVVLTFLLAALGVWCDTRIRAAGGPALLSWFPVLALAALAQGLHTDYSWFGVVMTFLLCRCGDRHSRKLALLSGGMIFFYLLYDPMRSILPSLPPGPLRLGLVQLLPAYAANWLPYHLLNTFFACVPVALLAFYRGERGKGGKWFFYWFYPVHLLLLFFLRILISAQ